MAGGSFCYIHACCNEQNNISEHEVELHIIRNNSDLLHFSFLQGLDTVSHTTQSTLFFLALHPTWQQRVYDEMKEVFGSEEFESDQDLNVTEEQIARLECLDCSWKEAMRLHTAVPLIGRNLSQNVVLGNYNIEISYHVR
jgi:cytochrome P450